MIICSSLNPLKSTSAEKEIITWITCAEFQNAPMGLQFVCPCADLDPKWSEWALNRRKSRPLGSRFANHHQLPGTMNKSQPFLWRLGNEYGPRKTSMSKGKQRHRSETYITVDFGVPYMIIRGPLKCDCGYVIMWLWNTEALIHAPPRVQANNSSHWEAA